MPARFPLVYLVAAMATGTVLVVEGNPGVLIVARNVLGRQGHTVVTASEPTEGLWKAQADLPDVAILDASYAVDEVLFALSRVSPVELPILLSAPTGRGREVQDSLPKLDGVEIAGVIEKPFTPDSLSNAVRETLIDHQRTRPLRIDSARFRPRRPAPTDAPVVTPLPATGADTIQETLDAEAACELIDVNVLGLRDPAERPPSGPWPGPRDDRVASAAAPKAVLGGFSVSARARRLATRIRRVTRVAPTDDAALEEACEEALRDEVLFSGLGGSLSGGDPLVAGRLGPVEVPQVLQLAEGFGRPVCCRFEREVEAVEVVVSGRSIRFARQDNLPEVLRLGRFIVELGVLAGRNLSFAVEDARRAGRRLGAHLVGEGVITPEHLSRALARQATELVFEVLAWRAGSFAIFPCDPLPPDIEEAGVELPVTGVVLDGLRRQDEWGPTCDATACPF